MPTVYAINTQLKLKVRYDGVVHFAGSESTMGAIGNPSPVGEPYAARCGLRFNGEETPVYLERGLDILVTCIACTVDRRKP